MGKSVSEIPKRTIKMLQSYPWPGNVRELKHAVEGALITAQGKKLNFELPQLKDTGLSDFQSFEEMERDYILRVLKAKNWRIGGKNSAASTLGMHVNTLRGRMKKLGIKRQASISIWPTSLTNSTWKQRNRSTRNTWLNCSISVIGWHCRDTPGKKHRRGFE